MIDGGELRKLCLSFRELAGRATPPGPTAPEADATL